MLTTMPISDVCWGRTCRTSGPSNQLKTVHHIVSLFEAQACQLTRRRQIVASHHVTGQVLSAVVEAVQATRKDVSIEERMSHRPAGVSALRPKFRLSDWRTSRLSFTGFRSLHAHLGKGQPCLNITPPTSQPRRLMCCLRVSSPGVRTVALINGEILRIRLDSRLLPQNGAAGNAGTLVRWLQDSCRTEGGLRVASARIAQRTYLAADNMHCAALHFLRCPCRQYSSVCYTPL